MPLIISFWKLNPIGYHITNILFYILTCIMVFFTLRLLSAELRKEASPNSHGRVAIFGALLFAAHPVHVEAVTWLAARKEVLQGFFFFLAFYLYLKARQGDRRRRLFTLPKSRGPFHSPGHSFQNLLQLFSQGLFCL